MKLKYACEVCGKYFDTEEEAAQCEKQHEEEKNKEQRKKDSENMISSLIKKHIEEYGEFPKCDVICSCGKGIESLLDMLTSWF